MKPGEIITCKEEDFINANEGLETIMLRVSNLGDRPIQVGSHMHFFEVNRALKFDREVAKGFRLMFLQGRLHALNREIQKKSNWCH